MHWDDLRYALGLARAGTLSAAAESLGVSHTTVGRRLRALEERLGYDWLEAWLAEHASALWEEPRG